MHLSTLVFLLLPLFALARTDLSGCTSSISGPSLIWYVPGSCELCEIPDCGGGRAPPKTDNPACPNYSGTSTYSPSYLSGCNGGAAAATSNAIAGGPKSAGAGPTTAPASGSTTASGSVVTNTITLIAANATATSTFTSSNSSIAAAETSTFAAATTEAALTTAAPTPSAPSGAASSSSTGGANIMTIGLNFGGAVIAVGMGAMAML